MHISYARILVEANVTKKLPTELTLQDPSGRMFQQQNNASTKAQAQDQPIVTTTNEPSVKSATAKDKGKAKESQNQELYTEWPALTSNRKIIPGQLQYQLVMDFKSCREKMRELRILCLLIEEVKEAKAERVMSRITPGWNMITNYEHAMNGRVWIIWDNQMYEVQPIDKQDQFIHCQVIGKHNGMQCYLIVVYGKNVVEQRKNLWQHLQRIAQTTTRSWIIGGDFNTLLTPQDRLSKVSLTNADIRDFSEHCLPQYLCELPWRDDYFIWTNKQQVDARVWSRINRLLGNDVWMMNNAI
ncbi:PREDICTED: uncharacterized protein LOC109225024 [Nicotiana attenuata]|uniref:uncharacterized protein LOC109225024 n=1 Tax=Nicotiana attenuata TaxID=49451 RepID=UPI0009050207|nr:PREDICTED: uncharacterized protein LOC109225024 [Nicotiana attenuata]